MRGKVRTELTKMREAITGKHIITEEEKERINPAFIADIAPLGNVNFQHEKFVSTGSGYEACLYVFGYPKKVGAHWLILLASIEDTICVLDISSTKASEVKKNLKKSLEEQDSRYRTAKTNADLLDAEQQFAELEEMYREVNSFGKVMKRLLARIYVSGKTMYEVDLKLREITEDLEGSGFKCSVCLNETKSDWRNVFLSYTQQQQTQYNRRGQELLSKALAGGNPFHFSSLTDPYGTYYGETQTGGPVLLDLFYKTDIRLSYDFLFAGKKGSGKSTALKIIIEDRAAKGDQTRIFDVSGEFTDVCHYLGGKVIYLDGQKDSIINILQILPDENQAVAYNKHVAKVATIYTYLKKGDVDENELLILKSLLRLLYKSFKIIDEQGELIIDLKSAKAETFPTLSNLLELCEVVINNYDSFSGLFQAECKLRESHIPFLESIELKINDLCQTYGRMFDGHTSVENFYDQKIVCFNMQHLAGMEEEVFDAQLYNALSLCWDNSVVTGSKMKSLYHAKKIAWEDIVRTLIVIDEAHRSINATKLAGVIEVANMMREGRKWFTGIGLASLSVRNFVPDNADSEAVEQLKMLFELTTYKFIMNQDSNAVSKIKDIFGTSFSEVEAEKVPMLAQRECILSIAGDRNLEFTWRKITEAEDVRFGGGA